jgi:hypothetical protein
MIDLEVKNAVEKILQAKEQIGESEEIIKYKATKIIRDFYGICHGRLYYKDIGCDNFRVDWHGKYGSEDALYLNIRCLWDDEYTKELKEKELLEENERKENEQREKEKEELELFEKLKEKYGNK